MKKMVLGLALGIAACGKSPQQQALEAQAAAMAQQAAAMQAAAAAQQAAMAQVQAAQAQAQAQAAAMQAAQAQPTALGVAPVAATPCAQWRACCDGLAGMPGMEAMRSSCANMGDLEASPTGATICASALQSASQMPNAPAACAAGLPTAAATIATAAAGTSCAKWRACCDAMANMPGMASMRASCATLDQLNTPQQAAMAEGICGQMLTGFATMPNAPPACR